MEKKKVILFYKYVKIEDVFALRDQQKQVCKELNLIGRVLVATEGINGTLAGDASDIDAYMEFMMNHVLFEGIEFKVNFGDDVSFNKLKVKAREEIVATKFGADLSKTGMHLSPSEFQRMIDEDPEAVVVDFRNDYEYRVGRFKGAVNLELENFRDLPKVVEKLEPYKNKKILAYCTGGVRCETATALLREKGFENLYQLHGGIIKYAEQFPDRSYEGSCFVFDNRMTVPVNRTKDLYVSNCEICEEQCDVYINCANCECNKLFIVCEPCAEKVEYSCSEVCAQKKRNFEQKDYIKMIKSRYSLSKNNI